MKRGKCVSRRRILQGAGAGSAAAAAGLASAFPAPAIAQSQPEIRWRLTSSFPKSLDTLYGTAEVFASMVAAATENRFRIQVFAPGEIVPSLAAADAVAGGTVEAAHTSSYYYWGKDPTFAFGTTVPFGLNARMQNAWMYASGGIDLMNAFYERYNIFGLPGGNTGAQMGGWYRREINRLEDLKGLKIRIGGFGGAVLAKLGAVPQQIPGGEIYAALETGTIDAAEWVGPYDDEKLGFHKIAPNYYYPGWWEGQAMLHFFFNLKAWAALPPVYQAILRTCAQAADLSMMARYDSLNDAALRRLVTAGAQLKAFPEPVLDACFKASTELYDEISAKNPTFKKVYDAMRKVRAENYQWFQVSEYTFDTYMMIQSRKGLL